MMFNRFKGVLNFRDSTFHFISHLFNITSHRAILGINRLNVTSSIFNSYSRFNLLLPQWHYWYRTLVSVVLYMLKLVFSLKFLDRVSRREAMLIYGNRFHLGPVHTSHFCRVEFNSIKCGRNATADSYVEFLPNLIL